MNAPSASCDLCGLPLRSGRFTSDSSEKKYRFCCSGCRQVFHMLLEAPDRGDPGRFKDSDLFRKCQELGILPGSEAYGSQEKENAAKILSLPGGSDTLSLLLRIQGMWCPACAWFIDETLKRTQGIIQTQCHFSTDLLRCAYQPALTRPSEIIQTIEGLGYGAAPLNDPAGSKERSAEFIRFAISAFLTANVMMFSLGLYSGFFSELPHDTIHKLSWPPFIMASIVLFYGGRRIYQRAWAGISSSAFGMETLITVGALSAYLYSTYQLFSGSIHLYYDTASMLVTLVLLGKALEGRAKGEIRRGLTELLSLRPSKARICGAPHSRGRYVSVEHLRKGDLFQVDPGEIIPADGTVLQGRGSVDESSLTGESRPVSIKAGGRVKGGARVIHGAFRARAEAVGDESTLGQMLRIIEKGLGSEFSFEGKTDRIIRWFVPAIFILALGAGLACLISGLHLEDAILRSVTVLVIACPCTLGLAIPLARVAGMSLAGKRGLLVRDFSSFEKAGEVSALVFDKTGTMTEGRWRLLKIVPIGPFSAEEVLAQAASLERDSEHYIAVELRARAEEAGIRPAAAGEIRTFENGISGRIAGDEVKIGSQGFLREELSKLGPHAHGAVPQEDVEHSHVFMSTGGRVSALFIFGDRIKETASSAVKRLRREGYRIALVSGDSDETTRAVGRKIGIDESYGGKLPQDKVSFVRRLQREGHKVVMIGDGINDAPSLLQSDLAIAVYSGGHLGEGAADITLMKGDPEQVLDFLGLATEVNKKIRQNLWFTFLYNVVSIPVAMSGWLSPLVAVSAMLLSSLSVILNTLLLIRKAPRS